MESSTSCSGSSSHGPHLPFSWEKAPPGSAQQGSSLVISECVTLCHQHRAQIPASPQGSQQPAKAPPAHWTHTGAAQAHFSSQTSQPLPREFSGCWGQAQPHTLGSTRAQGQALSTTLTGQNQLKAD